MSVRRGGWWFCWLARKVNHHRRQHDAESLRWVDSRASLRSSLTPFVAVLASSGFVDPAPGSEASRAHGGCAAVNGPFQSTRTWATNLPNRLRSSLRCGAHPSHSTCSRLSLRSSTLASARRRSQRGRERVLAPRASRACRETESPEPRGGAARTRGRAGAVRLGGNERGCPLDPSRATVSANAVSANVGRRSLRAKRAGPSSGISTAASGASEERSERAADRREAAECSNGERSEP